MQSESVVCLHSRLSLAPFGGLSPDAAVDDLLLQHALTLELRAANMVQKVFSVLVGDPMGSCMDGSVSNHFLKVQFVEPL